MNNLKIVNMNKLKTTALEQDLVFNNCLYLITDNQGANLVLYIVELPPFKAVNIISVGSKTVLRSKLTKWDTGN